MPNWRERVTDSAIDFALNAFWVAFYGAVVTGVIAAYGWWNGWWQGISERWLWAVIASLLTFIFVLLTTAAMVAVTRHSQRRIRPVGRKGLIDFVHDRDRAMSEMNRHLTRLAKETVLIGKIANKYAPRIQRAATLNWRWLQIMLVKQFAAGLNRRAIHMGVHGPMLAASVDAFINNTQQWLAWMRNHAQPVSDQGFFDSLHKLKNSSEVALPNLKGFRDSTERQRLLGADLDIAGGRVVAAMDQVIVATERLMEFCGSVTSEPQAH